MHGYAVDLEQETIAGTSFRKVLYTSGQLQLVIMALRAGEEIGLEKHDGHDQFIRVEEGEGSAILDGERVALRDGIAVIIPAGVEHNIVATTDLKLYTLYGPPEHPDGTEHKTKAEADDYERRMHG